MIALWLDHRQAVFDADHVTQALDGKRRPPEVAELACAVKCRGVEDDVIVDMRPVDMRGNRKSVVALLDVHWNDSCRCHVASFPK